LLEEGRRLAVGRASERPGSGLAEVADRLLPQLAFDRVVCEPLRLLVQAIGVEPLDCLDDAGVERAPTFLEKAAVSHLVGERALEGVLQLGEQTRLRARGIEPIMLMRSFRWCLDRGFTRLEQSQVLDDNRVMQRYLKLLGASVYKKYRVYEKPLRPGP